MVAGVGEAVMNTIWDGMRAVWDGIVDWLNAKLEWFRSQLPHSEPKDPRSPLRGLRQSGMAIVEMLREGMESAGPLFAPELVRPSATPAALMARGAPAQTTYNQQRTTSLNYHTTYAPPASQSLALASAVTFLPCDSTSNSARKSKNPWLVWQLVDSAFPTGGFAHSGGLEAAWQQVSRAMKLLKTQLTEMP